MNKTFQSKANRPIANRCMDYKRPSLNKSVGLYVGREDLKWTQFERVRSGHIGTLPPVDRQTRTETLPFRKICIRAATTCLRMKTVSCNVMKK